MEPRTAPHPAVDQPPAAAVDLVAEDIGEAVLDLSDGRLTRARRRLSTLWVQAPVTAAHRSALAHWLAVVEPDPQARVAWDERALGAAELVDDWAVPFAGTGLTVGDMYPELHLELADSYRTAGSACGALEHLALARNAVEVYASGERRFRLSRRLDRLERRVGAPGEPEPEQDWGWVRESEPDLVDFWDGEGAG